MRSQSSLAASFAAGFARRRPRGTRQGGFVFSASRLARRQGPAPGVTPARPLPAMLAPGPAARPAHAFLQLLLRSANATCTRRVLLCILDPANEFVAGQRRDVRPGRERSCVREQRLTQVRRELVHHSTRHDLLAHEEECKRKPRSVVKRRRARRPGPGGGDGDEIVGPAHVQDREACASPIASFVGGSRPEFHGSDGVRLDGREQTAPWPWSTRSSQDVERLRGMSVSPRDARLKDPAFRS